MWNTYCKFAVNDIKNTIFILVLSHWMISSVLPGWLGWCFDCPRKSPVSVKAGLGVQVGGSDADVESLLADVFCAFRGSTSEAVVVAEKVRQVLGKGKMKFSEWRKERENKGILDSCRTEELEHLENTKMRRISEGRWFEQENAGCVDGDECVSHSLCQLSCGGKKRRAFSWNSNSWVKWLSPAMHPEPLQLQKLLHQCSCCHGIRPRGWHIPEDSVTHTSTCSSCCTGQNKSNHFFDPLFLKCFKSGVSKGSFLLSFYKMMLNETIAFQLSWIFNYSLFVPFFILPCSNSLFWKAVSKTKIRS